MIQHIGSVPSPVHRSWSSHQACNTFRFNLTSLWAFLQLRPSALMRGWHSTRSAVVEHCPAFPLADAIHDVYDQCMTLSPDEGQLHCARNLDRILNTLFQACIGPTESPAPGLTSTNPGPKKGSEKDSSRIQKNGNKNNCLSSAQVP